MAEPAAEPIRVLRVIARLTEAPLAVPSSGFAGLLRIRLK
jgi:hypothetical protein